MWWRKYANFCPSKSSNFSGKFGSNAICLTFSCSSWVFFFFFKLCVWGEEELDRWMTRSYPPPPPSLHHSTKSTERWVHFVRAAAALSNFWVKRANLKCIPDPQKSIVHAPWCWRTWTQPQGKALVCHSSRSSYTLEKNTNKIKSCISHPTSGFWKSRISI